MGLFPLGLFRLGLFAIRLFPAGIFSIWTFSKAPRFPRTRSTISPKSSQAQDPSKVEIRYQENSVDAPPHAHPLELVPHPLEARRNARVLLKLKKDEKWFSMDLLWCPVRSELVSSLRHRLKATGKTVEGFEVVTLVLIESTNTTVPATP